MFHIIIPSCIQGLLSDGTLAWRFYIIFDREKWALYLPATALVVNARKLHTRKCLLSPSLCFNSLSLCSTLLVRRCPASRYLFKQRLLRDHFTFGYPKYYCGLGLVLFRHQHVHDRRYLVQTHVRHFTMFYVRIPNFVIIGGSLTHGAVCLTTAY